MEKKSLIVFKHWGRKHICCISFQRSRSVLVTLTGRRERTHCCWCWVASNRINGALILSGALLQQEKFIFAKKYFDLYFSFKDENIIFFISCIVRLQGIHMILYNDNNGSWFSYFQIQYCSNCPVFKTQWEFVIADLHPTIE